MSLDRVTEGQSLLSNKEKLKTDLQEFRRTYEKRHGSNYWLHHGLFIVGIIVAAGVAVAGILGSPTVAAILGVVSSTILAIDSGWALRELAEFQRIIARKARNLISDLDYAANSEAEVEAIRRSFLALAEHADRDLPRGSGMDAVRRMYEDIESKRKAT